jgi:hypothetical protein
MVPAPGTLLYPGAVQLGLPVISKLRCDANLRFLYGRTKHEVASLKNYI